MAEKQRETRKAAGGEFFARLCSNRLVEERVFPRAAEAEEEFSRNCQGLKVSAGDYGDGIPWRRGEDALAVCASALERLRRNRLEEERVFPRAAEVAEEFESACQGFKVCLGASRGRKEAAGLSLAERGKPYAAGEARGKGISL